MRHRTTRTPAPAQRSGQESPGLFLTTLTLSAIALSTIACRVAFILWGHHG